MLENRGGRRAAVPNIFSPGWQILWLLCGIGGRPILRSSLSQEDLLSSRSFQDFDPSLPPSSPSKRVLSGRKSREKNRIDTTWTLEEIEKNRQTSKKIIVARKRVGRSRARNKHGQRKYYKKTDEY